ncbi:hypothetical protein J2S03_002041 [Alicyclobacillus cycloheptanicus]|uniref:Uncharacterized protein n=1 Tax=Alicyclobacillus cycloheptanicus TaxID=1457 RepID=A0ABT9XIN7_9BACL|nr:hypothetical protein [Alicyclobacillus cycloheptanicus]
MGTQVRLHLGTQTLELSTESRRFYRRARPRSGIVDFVLGNWYIISNVVLQMDL